MTTRWISRHIPAGLAVAALLGALGCGTGEPGDGTDFIFQNAHRVVGMVMEFDAPGGRHVEFEMPANDRFGEFATIHFNVEVKTGDQITFNATWNGITASNTCTVTPNMMPVEGDDTKGFAVVWVQAIGAPENVINILCNW
jgi:hypothetical protein